MQIRNFSKFSTFGQIRNFVPYFRVPNLKFPLFTLIVFGVCRIIWPIFLFKPCFSWTLIATDIEKTGFEGAYKKADSYCKNIGKSLFAAQSQGIDHSMILAYTKQWKVFPKFKLSFSRLWLIIWIYSHH